MSVSSYSQPDVVTVEGEASLREVATKLDDENVGTVVVVEGDEPVGVVTDRDIALAVGEGGDVSDAAAADAMPDEVATLESDADEVVPKMAQFATYLRTSTDDYEITYHHDAIDEWLSEHDVDHSAVDRFVDFGRAIGC